MPITKWNYMVSRADEIAGAVHEAFAIARSGRPGPVLLDILKNATAEEADFSPGVRGEGGSLGALAARLSPGLAAP